MGLILGDDKKMLTIRYYPEKIVVKDRVPFILERVKVPFDRFLRIVRLSRTRKHGQENRLAIDVLVSSMNAGIAASCAPTRFIGLARYASIFSRYKHLTTKLKCRPTWCYRCLSFRERYHALHAFNARSNGDRQLARIKYFQTIVQRCFTRAVRDSPVALIELIWK